MNSLESQPNQNPFSLEFTLSSVLSIENHIGIPVALVPMRDGEKSFASNDEPVKEQRKYSVREFSDRAGTATRRISNV